MPTLSPPLAPKLAETGDEPSAPMGDAAMEDVVVGSEDAPTGKESADNEDDDDDDDEYTDDGDDEGCLQWEAKMLGANLEALQRQNAELQRDHERLTQLVDLVEGIWRRKKKQKKHHRSQFQKAFSSYLGTGDADHGHNYNQHDHALLQRILEEILASINRYHNNILPSIDRRTAAMADEAGSASVAAQRCVLRANSNTSPQRQAFQCAEEEEQEQQEE